MREACARIRVGARAGTGFFVATDLLITCSHIVASLPVGGDVIVSYAGSQLRGTIRHKDPMEPRPGPPWPFPDVAVIQLEQPVDVIPLQMTRERVVARDALEAFGFPIDGNPGGTYASYICDGYAYPNEIPQAEYQINLIEGSVRLGMSGAPVALRGTRQVVAMIVDTINPQNRSGGHATPTEYLIKGVSTLDHVQLAERPVQTGPEITENFPAPSAELLVASAGIASAEVVETELAAAGGAAAVSTSLIEQSRALRRRGRPREAHGTALLAFQDPRFSGFPKDEKAAILRELALTNMEVGDLDEAERLCSQASTLDASSPRQIGLQAELQALRQGPEAALSLAPAGVDPEIDVLRAIFLLHAGRFDEARNVLEELPESIRNDFRTQRIATLVDIGRRDRESMLRHADAAFPGVRGDVQVAHVVGVAYVLAQLSPGFWPTRLWTWPQPIPRDGRPQSQSRQDQLSRARQAFDIILATSESNEEQVASFETWRFVALALDETQRQNAASEGRRLLQGDQPNYRVIPWIWALQVDVDVYAAMDLIRAKVERREATPEEVLVIVADALQRGRAVDAERVLNEAETAFTDEWARPNWHYFMFLSLHDQHRDIEAEVHMGSMLPEQRRAAELVLAEDRAGNEAATLAQLAQRYEDTHDPLVLVTAAEVAHRAGNWAFLADRGEELLATFGTVSAARYAAYGSFNVLRYVESIERIAEYARQAGTLPEDLLRLRALALERSGNPTAREAYQALITAHPRAENLHLFARYDAAVANFAHIVTLGQQLLTVTSTPEVDFDFVQLIRHYDAELARRIWRRAMAAGAPEDRLVPRAFFLALQLGLGPETGLLQEPMQRLALAGQHGIEAVATDQLAERLHSLRERTENIVSLYQRGEVCIHLLSSETNATLVTTHVQSPRQNAAASSQDGWHPIYVRHGSRPIAPLPTGIAALYLDVTSLLIAADLGILQSDLADNFRLRIPDSLVGLLGSYRDRLEPGSEQREAALRRVLELADTNAIEVTERDIVELSSELGGVVCDWAAHDGGSAIVTPRRLVDSLRRSGAISSTAHAAALVALGNIQEDIGSDPSDVAPILFTFNTVETLQEAGALEALRNRHRVIVERRYIDVVRSELRSDREKRELSRWLAAILEYLRGAIIDGRVTLVPRRAGNESINERAEMLELLTMFASFAEPTVICVDDRFANAFPRRDDGTPVVSLYDVLHTLRLRGRMSEDRYLALMHELRSRAFFYIPVTEDEIIFHVRRSMGDQEFSPTLELRTLERYIAFAMLDTTGLNAPDAFEVGPRARQVAFLASCAIATRGAIRAALAETRRR